MNRMAIPVLLAAIVSAVPDCGNLLARDALKPILLPPACAVEASALSKPAVTFRNVYDRAAGIRRRLRSCRYCREQRPEVADHQKLHRAGSSENIRWLRDHPERRAHHLFGLEPQKGQLTRLPDSTVFGFVPNSTLVCDGTVRFYDTRTHKNTDVVFPHALASECAAPGSAISPDGSTMAAQTDDSLRFWDLGSLESISPELAQSWVWNMKFSSDGKWLFTRRRHELKILEPKPGNLRSWCSKRACFLTSSAPDKSFPVWLMTCPGGVSLFVHLESSEDFLLGRFAPGWIRHLILTDGCLRRVFAFR